MAAEANNSIDLKEFIPLASVDPAYFENLTISAPTEAVKPYSCSLIPWPRPAGVAIRRKAAVIKAVK